MKKQILTTTLCIISLFAITQNNKCNVGDYVLDSVITTKAIMFFDTLTQYKDSYKYNDSYMITGKYRFTNVKSSHPYLIEWLLYEETKYSYTNEIILNREVFRKRDNVNSDLENSNMWTYDNTLNSKISILSYWENLEWRQRLRITDTYNPLTFYKIYLKEYTNDITYEWENYSRKDSIWRQDGMLDIIKSFNFFDPMIMDTSYFISYDYSYYPDTTTSYTWLVDTSQIQKQYYDSSLTCYVKYNYRIIDGENRPLSQTLSYFNENNQRTLVESFQWYQSSNQWELTRYTEYFYNEMNQLIETLNHSVSYSRSTYEYNSAGLISMSTHYPNAQNTADYDQFEYYYAYKYIDINQKNDKSIFYPNPVNNFINIENQNLEFNTYQVLSISGKLVKTGNINSNQKTIDTSFLPSGIYILTLTGNKSTKSQEIIKY